MMVRGKPRQPDKSLPCQKRWHRHRRVARALSLALCTYVHTHCRFRPQHRGVGTLFYQPVFHWTVGAAASARVSRHETASMAIILLALATRGTGDCCQRPYQLYPTNLDTHHANGTGVQGFRLLLYRGSMKFISMYMYPFIMSSLHPA